MAVELVVTGNGKFKGSSSNLTSYTTTEDATPIVGTDSSGGVGQLDFSVVENAAADGTILLLNDTVELTDGSNGRTQGIVTSVQGSNDTANVTGTSRLGLLMAEKQAAPYTGTLGGAFTYYLSLAGITTGYVVDSSITGRAVTYPGWYGNIWNFIKQICVAEQVEVSLVSSNIVMRPLRTRVAQNWSNISEGWSVANGELAQNIEVNYYNNQRIVNGLAYPIGGWTPDVQAYQVDAGQTLNINVPVNVYLESVQQPGPVLFVDRYYTGPDSVYAIAGKDGLPIPPAQWTAGGGSVTVAIGADGKSLDLTIVGTSLTQYSPYRLAVSAGPSDYYSALRIVGTGVYFNKQTITVPTGAPASKTATVIGATIDNPFISTLAQAYDAAMRAGGKFASPEQTISITTAVVNRKGDKGTFNYPVFTNFTAQYSPKTFATFNTDTTVVGKTFAQWDVLQAAQVQDSFENQAFGNAVGARVRFRQQWYRIRTASITPAQVSYEAERDTIFSDFSTVWTGGTTTFSAFNTRWSGKTFEDYGVISLWR